MKTFIVLLCLISASVAFAAPAEYPDMGPDIYDPKADGQNLINVALIRTKTSHKNVLVVFGANWCPWCRKLHGLFRTDKDVAAALARDFEVVLVDVNMRHGVKRNDEVNTRYGNPIKEGLPVLVMLDAEGKILVTQESGVLEDGPRHDPAKVLGFLKRWAPKPATAAK